MPGRGGPTLGFGPFEPVVPGEPVGPEAPGETVALGELEELGGPVPLDGLVEVLCEPVEVPDGGGALEPVDVVSVGVSGGLPVDPDGPAAVEVGPVAPGVVEAPPSAQAGPAGRAPAPAVIKLPPASAPRIPRTARRRSLLTGAIRDGESSLDLPMCASSITPVDEGGIKADGGRCRGQASSWSV